MKHEIFKTAWGWVGVVATDRGVRAVVLPQPTRGAAARGLLEEFIAVGFSKFVLVPAEEPRAWAEEIAELAGELLPLTAAGGVAERRDPALGLLGQAPRLFLRHRQAIFGSQHFAHLAGSETQVRRAQSGDSTLCGQPH